MTNKHSLDPTKIFGWLFVLFMLFLLISLSVPAVMSTHCGSRHTKSLNNLKQIGLALKMYAADNNDEYPRGHSPEAVYGQLLTAYMPNNCAFISPGDKGMRNVPVYNKILIGRCGYTYISGSSEKSDPKTPLATERVQNPFTLSNTNQPLKEVFNGIGVNVLCVDGSVYFLPARNGVLSNLFTDAQIHEGKLRPRNPFTLHQNH